MIHIDYFIITSKGDPEIGIEPCKWELQGNFDFITEDQIKMFTGLLKKAYEYAEPTAIKIIDSRHI